MVSKKQFIAAALLIFIIAGAVPMMGIAVKSSERQGTITDDTKAVAPDTAAVGTMGTYSNYKVVKLDTWTLSDANLAYLRNPSTGVTYVLTVKPNTGNMGIDIWTTLNAALTSGKYVTVYTDSSNYIYNVIIYA